MSQEKFPIENGDIPAIAMLVSQRVASWMFIEPKFTQDAGGGMKPPIEVEESTVPAHQNLVDFYVLWKYGGIHPLRRESDLPKDSPQKNDGVFLGKRIKSALD